MKPESDLLNELTAENKYQPIDDKSSDNSEKKYARQTQQNSHRQKKMRQANLHQRNYFLQPNLISIQPDQRKNPLQKMHRLSQTESEVNMSQ